MNLQRAKRSQARMKIGLGGPSGSGKTMSSLLIAYGLIHAEHPDWSDGQCWDKICIIDTENSSGSLYVDTNVNGFQIGEYYTIPLEPPFEASKYIEAIQSAENGQMEVIVIDSLTHAWTGVGGALDKQGKIAARTGNSYTAWRDVTPEHNRLVDTMLQSKCHVIADIRAKTDYVQQKDDRGKTVVKNVGMGLQMRDGIEYEFTTCFMLDADHIANATKDRTSLFDNKYFVITPDTGRIMYQWLTEGAEEASKSTEKPPEMTKAAPAAQTGQDEPVPVQSEPAEETASEEASADSNAEQIAKAQRLVDQVMKARCAKATPEERKAIAEELKVLTGGTANYFGVQDLNILRAIYKKYKE